MCWVTGRQCVVVCGVAGCVWETGVAVVCVVCVWCGGVRVWGGRLVA